MPNEATDADKVNKANFPDKAVDASEADEVEATQADEADAIVLFFIIANIVIVIPRSLLDEGIVVILYSLTKYSAVFAKRKGYFGIMISNNQCRRWSSCSFRMRDHVKFNNQLEVDNRS